MECFCKAKSGMRVGEFRRGTSNQKRYMLFKFETELRTHGYIREQKGIKQHINEVDIIELDLSIIHAPLLMNNK